MTSHAVGNVRLLAAAELMVAKMQRKLSSLDNKVDRTSEKVASQEKTIALLHDLPIQAVGGLLREIASYRSDLNEQRALSAVGLYLERYQPPSGY